MRIGLVNLVTKSSEILSEPTAMVKASNLAPASDAGLNIVEIGRRVASRGHEVRIFVSDVFKPTSPMPDEEGLRIEYVATRLVRLSPPALMPLTPSLGRILRDEELDVVQSGELFQPGTALSWLGSSPDVSFFVWQELDVLMRSPLGYAQSTYYRTIGRAIAKRCSSLIPRSISARNHLIQNGIRQDRISQVVHSGVDTRIFRPLDRQECMAKFGVDGNEEVILTAARLDPIKGLDLLIQAMVRVSEEMPRSVLVIQGDGPAYPELKCLVESLGLGESVRFIRQSFPHSEMAPLYSIADIFAITSRVDLFPFVAIEAISCGVPLATSFSRGLKTDIVDKGGGVMLPQDAGAMGDSLISLLQDRKRLAEIGRKCRRLAEEDFDFEVCADRLLETYGRAQ